MMFSLFAFGATAYGLLRFKIDELGSERLERLRDERAYFARLFAVDKRCLHHAHCTSDGPKNVESTKVYTEDEQMRVNREYSAQEDKKYEATLERKYQKETRKKARRIKDEPT